MRRVRLAQSRADCLTIEVGRDWRRAGALAFALAFTVLLIKLPETGSFAGVLAVVLGSLVCVAIAVILSRALARAEHTLVRSTGRLLLDGDPLELARVELRVLQLPVLRRPQGYVLSLWVMTLIGPEEVPLGHYATLLDASSVSGQLEEFIQRANLKQHRVIGGR
jgi:hypothetical protein